jgi:hypothetical protein
VWSLFNKTPTSDCDAYGSTVFDPSKTGNKFRNSFGINID